MEEEEKEEEEEEEDKERKMKKKKKKKKWHTNERLLEWHQSAYSISTHVCFVFTIS